jgi:hypothetical protein
MKLCYETPTDVHRSHFDKPESCIYKVCLLFTRGGLAENVLDRATTTFTGRGLQATLIASRICKDSDVRICGMYFLFTPIQFCLRVYLKVSDYKPT